MEKLTHKQKQEIIGGPWSGKQRDTIVGVFDTVIDSVNNIPGGKDGAKGDKGNTGAKGAKGDTGATGADGKSLKAIALTTDADGKVTGGTATLSDNSTIAITVTQA